MKRSLRKLVTLAGSGVLLGSQSLLLQQPTPAQTYLGANGCPAGTREGPENLIFNGNFAISPSAAGVGPNGRLLPNNPAGFTSSLPYRGDAVYPNDNPPAPTPRGGLSIQTGPVNYLGGVVIGQPFPGDPQFGAPASNTYLYSNPNASPDTPRVAESAYRNPDRDALIWSQVLTGLKPNTPYNFTGYFYNLLSPTAGGEPPRILLLAGPPGSPSSAFVPTEISITIATRQQWVRVQGAFNTTNLGSLELRVEDQARTIFGDDFGMTALAFRECLPITGGNVSNGNQRFRLVKRITNVTRNGATLTGVNFDQVVNDPGDINDDAPGWAQFPPVGVTGVDANNPLQSGDEITYTVYFLSDGDLPVRSVNICDPIPTATTFVSQSTQIQRPSTILSPGGAFFPPLTPLPADNSCPSQTNTNGSVLYDVGDVSNVAGNNFGLIRFRVRVN